MDWFLHKTSPKKSIIEYTIIIIITIIINIIIITITVIIIINLFIIGIKKCSAYLQDMTN